jgi:hypothetical protein
VTEQCSEGGGISKLLRGVWSREEIERRELCNMAYVANVATQEQP